MGRQHEWVRPYLLKDSLTLMSKTEPNDFDTMVIAQY